MYNNNQFTVGNIYTIHLTVTPDYQSQYRRPDQTEVTFIATCLS